MSDMEDKEVRRQKREGERREEEERKPLKKWTAEEVKAWFNFYREGKYAEFYEGFTDLDGEEMLGLSEEQYRHFAKNEAKGTAIYNVLTGTAFVQGGRDVKSDPKILLAYLRKLPNFKSDKEFLAPLQLAYDAHRFAPMDRRETFQTTYKAFTERLFLRERCGNESLSKEVKEANPLIALQAAPGGGKSYFLDLLAKLRTEDIDKFCTYKVQKRTINKKYVHRMRDILKSSVAVCVTFNGKSPLTDTEKKRGEMLERLYLRVLHSYFFTSQMPFSTFVKDMLELSLDFNAVLRCIRYHSQILRKLQDPPSILLCVDELIRAADDFLPLDPHSPLTPEGTKALVGLLHQVCAITDEQGPDMLNLVVSTLDLAPVVGVTTGSQRPVRWIPLPALTQISAEGLFVPLLTGVTNERRRQLQLCISDCAGHPRTLEHLYGILKDSVTYLHHARPAAILDVLADQQVLQMSTTTAAPFETVEMALRGCAVDRNQPISGNLTVAGCIACGIFINALNDIKNTDEVIPKLSAAALRIIARRTCENVKAPKANQSIALALLKICDCDHYFDGIRYELFHAWWEVLRRLLSNPNSPPSSLLSFYSKPDLPTQPRISFTTKNTVIGFKREVKVFPPPPGTQTTDGDLLTKDLLLDSISLAPPGTEGLDGAAFELKADHSGFIAINFECKFSEPGATTVLNPEEDVARKYMLMMNAYSRHLVGGQFATGTHKSAVGELQLKPEDVFLVICSWRYSTVQPPNGNIIILSRTELERLYSPSLVSRPHFLWQEGEDERNEQLAGSQIALLSSVRVNQLREYCGRRGIKVEHSKHKDPYVAAIKKHLSEKEEQDAKTESKLSDKTEGKEEQNKDTKKSKTKNDLMKDREQEREEVRESESSNECSLKQPAKDKKRKRDKTEEKEEQNKDTKKSKTENDLMKDREQNRKAEREKIKMMILTKQSLAKVRVATLREVCEKEDVKLTSETKTKNAIAKVLLHHWTKGAQCG